MPRKNTQRIDQENSYYHVFNRGVNKETIFLDSSDYIVFLSLFKRYLSNQPAQDVRGHDYIWLQSDIDLLAFCLMPNHFHAFVYQINPGSVSRLFGAVLTAYGMYFNKKYDRIGPVFQSKYKSKLINQDVYLMHISRYIHLNPKNYQKYDYSSLPYYLGTKSAEWLRPAAILDLFSSIPDYEQFLMDYKDYRNSLDTVRTLLASE
ncbi:transposase [Candidatus Saccharibacteria bacterium]|nr:transposase [Candidatus Saccharibacteria bacterium]